MATIHISESEAAKDHLGLLARIDENTSFLIENGNGPVALLQPAATRKLSLRERIDRLPKRTAAIMDVDFSCDVQAGINSHREPLDPTRWE